MPAEREICSSRNGPGASARFREASATADKLLFCSLELPRSVPDILPWEKPSNFLAAEAPEGLRKPSSSLRRLRTHSRPRVGGDQRDVRRVGGGHRGIPVSLYGWPHPSAPRTACARSALSDSRTVTARVIGTKHRRAASHVGNQDGPAERGCNPVVTKYSFTRCAGGRSGFARGGPATTPRARRRGRRPKHRRTAFLFRSHPRFPCGWERRRAARIKAKHAPCWRVPMATRRIHGSRMAPPAV